jgi:nucleoid-associated protein YejK
MEAVYAYAGYKDFNEKELIEKQQALVEYCKQDTWAMVEILDELRKI